MTTSSTDNFTLGNFTIDEVLGIGAMGYVYRARQMPLDRDVAIKVLSPSLAQEVGYIDLFIREARMAASLEHPHIVPVFDYGIQQDISYVAMRLLTGGSLGDRINYRIQHALPMPSLTEVSRILTQAAAGLDYAHGRGVIHRDIKPNNLMFDQHGAVYIVDFGIAKLLGTTSSIKGSTFLGTPSFMAPEQWQGLPPTPAVDQYALGAVVYMMVTGQAPFESEIALALMNKHLMETPRRIEEFRPSAPDTVNGVLERAMAKQPTDRFPNNVAFAQAFADAIQSTEDEAATGFTTFPLPKAILSLPLPLTSKPPTGTATSEVTLADSTAQPPVSSGRRARIILWTQSVLLVIATILIGILITRQSTTETPAPTQIMALATMESMPPTTAVLEPLDENGSALVLQVEAAATITSTTEASAETATPMWTPSATNTHTPSITATSTPTETATASWTPSATNTQTPSHTPSMTATSTPTETATASWTPSATNTQTPSHTPSMTATSTPTETATASSIVYSPSPTVNWRNGTQLRVNNPSGVWLRARASTRGNQVATLAHNNAVTATGNYFYDGRQWWWEVTASWGAVGWVEQYSLVVP